MRKRFGLKQKKLRLQIKKVRIDETQPFHERPSIDRDPSQNTSTNTENKNPIEASELFSHFTADIIRKDVPFTR
jgi:hypothetical protein